MQAGKLATRLRNLALLVLLLAAATVALLAWLWQGRPALDDVPLTVAEPRDARPGEVTVTWLGVSTLLFDDGETQILTDALFSRPKLFDILLLRPLESDYAAINRALDEFHINRLAAIIPLHAHFDHVMDAGHVANRTGALVLGSESSANVARGSGVPVDQYQTLKSGEPRYFGKFTITLIESRHVPQLPGGGPFFSGIITEPLRQPAPVSAWKAGTAYTVLISHPRGTALVQGSAGFVPGRLADVEADVALLSIAGVATHGKDYGQQYWEEIVSAVKAKRVLAIHYDDFTYPAGDPVLFPPVVDDIVTTGGWLRDFAMAADPAIEISLPPFGKPLAMF